MISHPKKPDWNTLFLLAGMYFVLISNVFLYEFHRLPAVVHILISIIAIHLAFTIWHEAAHGNTLKTSLGNSWVGVLGIFPYMTPYFIQRHIHLIHHAKLNQKEDPNLIYADGPFWQLPIRYFKAIPYLRNLFQNSGDPRKPAERVIDLCMTACVVGIYFFAWSQGRFIDALILWAIPVVFAKVIMDWYVNYLPHAGLPPHRYLGTRVVDIAWLKPLVLCHNYHAIHHLWPQQPWHRYYLIFKDSEAELIKNDVPIEKHLGLINFKKAAAIV